VLVALVGSGNVIKYVSGLLYVQTHAPVTPWEQVDHLLISMYTTVGSRALVTGVHTLPIDGHMYTLIPQVPRRARAPGPSWSIQAKTVRRMGYI
jgi:hypothetical protein